MKVAEPTSLVDCILQQDWSANPRPWTPAERAYLRACLERFGDKINERQWAELDKKMTVLETKGE